MNPKIVKLLIVALVLVLIVVFFTAGGREYLTLAAIKSQQAALQTLVEAHPLRTALLFGAAYVAVTALSLPGAAIMTLAAGAIFGFLPALILVSFASSIGATLAFLASRFVLRDSVERRFSDTFKTINDGVKREGSFYLFAMRLTPLVPFWMINLLMGLTAIRTASFYIISQLGMLPGTAVFVLAGTKLASIESTADILSPSLIGVFVLIGVMPLALKKVVNGLRARRGRHGT